MNEFLELPPERRLFAFQQVDEAMGLQAVSVEKDFWVCWTLRELFTMPGIGEHLINAIASHQPFGLRRM